MKLITFEALLATTLLTSASALSAADMTVKDIIRMSQCGLSDPTILLFVEQYDVTRLECSGGHYCQASHRPVHCRFDGINQRCLWPPRAPQAVRATNGHSPQARRR